MTDVDGTLVGHRAPFEQYQAFRRYTNLLRDKYDARWIICTGRNFRSFKHVFRPMTMLDITPDFVISRHAFIYERKSYGWMPHWTWNLKVLWLQWRHEWKVRRAIPRMRRLMGRKNPFARLVHESGSRITFQFEDEGATQFGLELIHRVVRFNPYLQVFRYPCEIDVRAIPYTKGLAVSELARHLGVPPPRVLVIGDGHNDISMMQPAVAKWTACPVNAAAEVMETVHATGGHIAATHSLAGVLEVLGAYESGTLNSALPPAYAHRDQNGPKPQADHPDGEGFGIRDLVTLVVIALVLAMVLASFDLLPIGQKLLGYFLRLVDALVHWIRH